MRALERKKWPDTYHRGGAGGGVTPPEFKTKVATALDIKRSWKEHPNIVHLVLRQAVDAWETVEQADKLRRVQIVRKVLSLEWAVSRRKNEQ